MLARGLDDPHWEARARDERRLLLHAALEGDAGRAPSSTRSASRSLSVFDAVMQGRHRYGPQAVGYFIVSGAAGADDVLAALLLARWAEAYDKRSGEVALDFAPMFESMDSLEQCATRCANC